MKEAVLVFALAAMCVGCQTTSPSNTTCRNGSYLEETVEDGGATYRLRAFYLNRHGCKANTAGKSCDGTVCEAFLSGGDLTALERCSADMEIVSSRGTWNYFGHAIPDARASFTAQTWAKASVDGSASIRINYRFSWIETGLPDMVRNRFCNIPNDGVRYEYNCASNDLSCSWSPQLP